MCDESGWGRTGKLCTTKLYHLPLSFLAAGLHQPPAPVPRSNFITRRPGGWITGNLPEDESISESVSEASQQCRTGDGMQWSPWGKSLPEPVLQHKYRRQCRSAALRPLEPFLCPANESVGCSESDMSPTEDALYLPSELAVLPASLLPGTRRNGYVHDPQEYLAGLPGF